MSPARPVVAAGSLHYRAAVAELPASARLSDHASEGVVVVPGEGPWWTSLVEAQAAGALAVVVSNPKSVSLAAFEALAAFLEDPVSVPVVVERPKGGEPVTLPDGWGIEKERAYGDTLLVVAHAG